MADLVKRIFLDPSRCIGCRSCVAACRECDTHKGESMIYIDYLERHDTVASSPTLCMHCEEPLAPCAQVCPAQAILVSPDGVVQSADETRCIYARTAATPAHSACPSSISAVTTCRSATCVMTAPVRARGQCARQFAQRRPFSTAPTKSGWRRAARSKGRNL